ncbi:flagellar M-ring protein FliF [Burkholderia stagnalis]|uniref:flagellar basal-body MS-ring/collar protein FliF n=1 Tax=Burkholderia stagnalis TaxID=1503054 RepID=UPI000F5F4F22|nr:flagellar basal-body MS-ring/collar protein FliF [Burkholderia stagnalis]RQX94964.1 flagellar M-ring protein FliF [Burkholderia stagnalis]RQY32516.1 flagellar M-ring protein FliF [Burkholderia stagnalis]RQY49591.1 flagellar M-ring protein FliF [Burkholderia stagnalis]RQY56612.1 flagellar M-ring protein FliF [Burkholderia stagnalis]RQY86386.1 flagellar M-ring protein FliF [Burkholderia stagnalis]
MESLLSRIRAAFADASPRRQLAGIAVLVALIASLIAAGYVVLRPRYQVLFRDLKPQDAASIIAELERQKVPFQVDESSSAILVPAADAQTTRLKLMSSDLRLQGAVGFELFSNSDLGLTDFAQKVNYQRALQGELARTIMSLDEIELARVHLAFPDSSLFRRADDRPKASVALFMRSGHTLGPDTVRGIQRLVAAAVPQMSVADVTVVDQRGQPAGGRDVPVDDPRYALKHALEREYERKIIAQIVPLLGSRHATVSVDATLNFDQVRVTNESDLSRPIASAGVSVPPPQSLGALARTVTSAVSPPPLPTVPSTDGTRTERRTEQIVSAPGSLKHLSISVVVDDALSEDALAQLKSVAAAAVGADAARGDTVVAFSRRIPLDIPPTGNSESDPSHAASAADVMPPRVDALRMQAAAPADGAQRIRNGFSIPGAPISYVLALVLTLGIGLLLMRLAAGSKRSGSRSMTSSERIEYVTRLRALLSESRQHHES